MNKFSFVIPCYNYESFIVKNIKKLKKELKFLKIIYEIILIDDGSIDNTFKKLKFIKKKNRFIKIIKNKKNKGKSFSVIKGIKKSKYSNVVMIDCDLPYFQSIKKIVFYLKQNNHLVIVNRKLKESKLMNKNLNIYQIIRYFIGLIIAQINLRFLKIKIFGGDTQAGLKGFKKIKNFNKIKFISKKFFFDLELITLYSEKKLNILSIKTNYEIPKTSSIKIFNLRENIEIFIEWTKILLFYKKKLT